MNSGEVIIDTKIVTTKAEKKLAELKQQLEELDEEGKILEKRQISVGVKKENVENANRELQKYNSYLEKAKQKVEELNKKPSIGWSMEGQAYVSKQTDLVNYLTNEVEKYKQQLEEATEEYKKAVPEIERVNDAVLKNAKQQEEVRRKIEETNEEIKKQNLGSIKKQIEEISNSSEKVIKKVAHWALALFGIRSAYMLIRQAMSTLTQYDKQLATDLQYIRFTLASALAPIINFIVQLVYKVLQGINAVASALFGVNLFANASTKAFEKQNKALGGSAKSAKELKKQLTGIDEMNVLQENGSVSGGGGGGGIQDFTPTIDLSQINGSVLDDLTHWWDGILEFWDTEWYDFFTSFKGDWAELIEGVGFLLKGFFDYFSGIFNMIKGIVEMVWGVITLDTDSFIQGLTDFFGGFFKTVKGTIEALMGVFRIVFTTIYNTVMWAFNLIYGIFKGVLGVVNTYIIQPVVKVFKGLWEGISKGASNLWKGICDVFTGAGEWFDKNVIQPISKFFGGMWDGICQFASDAWGTMCNIFDNILDAIVAPINLLIDGINVAIDGLNLVNPFGSISHIPHLRSQKTVKGRSVLGNLVKHSNGAVVRGLATGAIVNQPNRGIPVASSYMGEAGREGILPLTDSQAMETLGQAIGKYISLNATIPVYMGNRQIAREIKKIEAEDAFAYNG